MDELLQVDDERRRALLANDLDAVAALLADDLTYIHSSGRVDTKASYLESLRSGTLLYREMALSEREVKNYGDISTLAGVAIVDLRANGQERRIAMRYATVWQRADGAPRLVLWASTPIPPAA
jgi:ketosteroid isomerase-like protein